MTVVLLVHVLMMAFALTAGALSQPALALVAGAGCVSLSQHLARRLLP